MQIIEKREFLELSEITDKYSNEYIIIGFANDDVSKGCPICTCGTRQEAKEVYRSCLKSMRDGSKYKDFFDFLIIPGTFAEDELIIE